MVRVSLYGILNVCVCESLLSFMLCGSIRESLNFLFTQIRQNQVDCNILNTAKMVMIFKELTEFIKVFYNANY